MAEKYKFSQEVIDNCHKELREMSSAKLLDLFQGMLIDWSLRGGEKDEDRSRPWPWPFSLDDVRAVVLNRMQHKSDNEEDKRLLTMYD